MDPHQIKRLYHTLKHLKFTQVYHQINYRLVKPRRAAFPWDGAFAQFDLASCKKVDFDALNIEIYIYGDGNQKNEILELDKNIVVYHEPVSKKEIQRIIANYDFSLIPLGIYVFGAFPS